MRSPVERGFAALPALPGAAEAGEPRAAPSWKGPGQGPCHSLLETLPRSKFH